MNGMPMPGGWTMSMAWTRMPGQSWAGAAATFLGMWSVMMAAMMLPSLIPALARYRRAAAATADRRLGRLTALVAAGYLLVWTLVGVAVSPLGAALVTLEMQRPGLARAVPPAIAIVLLGAGLLQLTPWKARQLACCRELPGSTGSYVASGAAWCWGFRLGLRCNACCLGLTAVLLVLGVMDLRVMATVTAAITAERLAPAGARVAGVLGGALAAAGVLVLAHAAGLG